MGGRRSRDTGPCVHGGIGVRHNRKDGRVTAIPCHPNPVTRSCAVSDPMPCRPQAFAHVAMTTKVRRLTTLLCADVEGYARLMEADEAGALETLRRYRAEDAA